MTAANPAQAAAGTVDDEGPAEVGRSATSGAPLFSRSPRPTFGHHEVAALLRSRDRKLAVGRNDRAHSGFLGAAHSRLRCRAVGRGAYDREANGHRTRLCHLQPDHQL